MQEYYLLCSYILEPGSIVCPGNWGRIVGLYTDKNHANYRREEIFEKVRKESFTDKPSRLKCIFLCDSEYQAIKFQGKAKRPFDLLYRVKLVDQRLPVFRTDYDKAVYNDGLSDEKAEEIARDY